MFRSLPMALTAATLIALAGCQHPPAPDADKQARLTFTSDIQKALTLGIANADTDEQVGVILQVLLDEHSAPIRCKARKALASKEALLPAEFIRSDFKKLASLVEAQCWKTIYPVVPKSMRDNGGPLDVRAPIVVHLPRAAQAPGTPRRTAAAQREYFWQHLFANQPVNSIGRASVYYEANAQGKVQACLAQIYPHPLRREDFRLDGKLQAELNSRCLALDLSKLPGFKADMHGVASGHSELEYAPWRVDRR